VRCIRVSALLLGGAFAVIALAALPAPARAGRPDVASLQVALRAMSLYGGDIDGISGPLTRRGVRRFQRRKRLTVDGVVGPRTRRALGRRGRPGLGRRAMKDGSRGWDVAGLQYLLRIRGFEAGGVDGGFGPNTLAAVRRFQSAAGLGVDGVAGPSTLGALRRRNLTRTRSPSSSGLGYPSGPVRFLRPVPGPMGDGFGMRDGRPHTGIDFPEAMGTKVGAAGVGVVISAGYNSGGYGNLVVVRHRLGFETWYAHLSAIAVSEGESVTGGSRIGSVGSTGRSTGPHLHFEVRLYGTPINPLSRLLSSVAARLASSSKRRRPLGRLTCRRNADAWNSRDTDPPFARYGRCP
jgi:murein DD-endopeptidase MepM/ murein hydrolase activator NlpD